MCMLAFCGVLFEEDVKLEQLKCSCGYTFTDILRDCFLDHRIPRQDAKKSIRQEKVPQTVSEAKKDPKMFEAYIRTRFMLHCINCGLLRRMYADEPNAGFDEQNLIRAFTEILEISRGDYESRGSSDSLRKFRPSPADRTLQEDSAQRRANPLERRPSRISGLSTSLQQNVSATTSHGDVIVSADPNARPLLPKPQSDRERPRTGSITQEGSRHRRPADTTTLMGAATHDEDQAFRRSESLSGAVFDDEIPFRGSTSHDNRRHPSKPRAGDFGDEERDRPQIYGSSPRTSIRPPGVSQHAVESTQSSEREINQARRALSPLMNKFLAFGYDQYDSLASFVSNSPDILKENPNTLQSLIISCLRRGEAANARRYAQRLLMLRTTWHKSLAKLSRDTQLQKELDEMVDKVLEKLGEQTARRHG
ncbi:hypothetical protein LTR05_006626 [Lithohypha guttulata]|uniref:Uncharacterized protein n=1 Tax=Lithohypha guttulata TaxID=1690604 RepID=A0AAN7SW16_9EURO|nr:hypothetical protein LTR05_006626 [Lithohypha guttulata]